MCDFQRIVLQKVRNWKKKHAFHRRKRDPENETKVSTPARSDSFRYIGFEPSQRLPPSSNQGFLVHDVPSLEQQTAQLMLDGFQRTFTPMDMTNNPYGEKILWVELIWRGQLPLYEKDYRGFHIPKRLRQTLNSRKFRVTVDDDFEVSFFFAEFYRKPLTLC